MLNHPGEYLADYLENSEVSQSAMAKTIGVKPGHINEIIRKKRGVSGVFALKLELATGINADTWLNLQKNYDLALALEENPKLKSQIIKFRKSSKKSKKTA
jgi:addiction module HigA family antidote